MLQPGMCSAISSESSTWIGPPGAFATQSAIAAVAGRRDVRAADADVRAFRKRVGEVRQPVRVGPGVGVDVGDDLAGGGLEPALRALARPRFSVLIRRKPYSSAISSVAVGRAVVDDDHLVVRDSRARAARRSSRAACARRCRCRRRPRCGGHDGLAAEGRLGERACRRLPAPASAARSRSTSPKAQSSISKPPRYHSSVQAKTNVPAQPAAKAVRTCQSSARAWASSLLRSAVEAGLGDHERAVAGDVLQPRQVGLELRPGLEEDVEADEVEERELRGIRCSGS